MKHIEHYYTLGDGVLIINKCMECKAKDKHNCHLFMTEVHAIGAMKIPCCGITELINFWRLTLFCIVGVDPLLEAFGLYLDGSDRSCLNQCMGVHICHKFGFTIYVLLCLQLSFKDFYL